VRREYQGAAQSARLTVALGGTTGDLTIYCDDLSNWPTGVSSRPFYVVIDRNTSAEEKILCASRSGNVITVFNTGFNGRGADDTSITAHSNNAVIEHVFTATDADEANSHVNDSTTDVHPQYVLESTVNAKGDLLVGTANDVINRQAVGTNGQILSANSATSTGLEWVNSTAAHAIAAARVNVTGLSVPTGDGISSFATINWPVGRFSVEPVVTFGLDDNAAAPGTFKAIFTADSSASSSTIYIANANTSTVITRASLNAIAIQMTSGSATG
jgi:hypothetical protein